MNWLSFFKRKETATPAQVGANKLLAVLAVLCLSACSTNPATGEDQFVGFMSSAQESKVGATEHQKVEQQFGFYDDPALNAYVNEVGAKVTQNTERQDVQYKFFILDSPIINAFALPGGYIYVSRGLLALADSEAELAAVMAHETGHITARHSAERYSQGVITSLGTAIIGAAVGNQGVSQALGVGSNLYLSSYSRGQESEADSLGLRYMTHAGYDAAAMSEFLAALQADTSLQSKLQGGDGSEGVSYFATHPATAERVNTTRTEAQKYTPGGIVNRDRHLQAIDGMIYGDSAKQGFVRGNTFYHPRLGFTFAVPEGFTIQNQPAQIVAVSRAGAALIFDVASAGGNTNALDYLTHNWIKGEQLEAPESITINGLPAADATFSGNLNGQPVTIRLVAIAWRGKIARFQIAIPKNASEATLNGLKSATYSFRDMTAAEQANIKPYRVKIITATQADSVASFSVRMPEGPLKEERFRVLNGLAPNEQVKIGQRYKIIKE